MYKLRSLLTLLPMTRRFTVTYHLSHYDSGSTERLIYSRPSKSLLWQSRNENGFHDTFQNARRYQNVDDKCIEAGIAEIDADSEPAHYADVLVRHGAVLASTARVDSDP